MDTIDLYIRILLKIAHILGEICLIHLTYIIFIDNTNYNIFIYMPITIGMHIWNIYMFIFY